jgi:hypothetical protein
MLIRAQYRYLADIAIFVFVQALWLACHSNFSMTITVYLALQTRPS